MGDEKQSGQGTTGGSSSSAEEWKDLIRRFEAQARREAARAVGADESADWATIGRRTGVANILGVNFSGRLAWWLWRTIYLLKLPRLEKKFRVALDWTLDLLFTKDLVQFLPRRTPVAVEAGY